MKNKKLIFLLVIIFLLFSGIIAALYIKQQDQASLKQSTSSLPPEIPTGYELVTIHGSLGQEPTLERAVEQSKVIVKGVITTVGDAFLKQPGAWRYVTIIPEEFYKNTTKESSNQPLKFIISGGTVGKVIYWDDYAPLLQPGEHIIIFLDRYDDQSEYFVTFGRFSKKTIKQGGILEGFTYERDVKITTLSDFEKQVKEMVSQ